MNREVFKQQVADDLRGGCPKVGGHEVPTQMRDADQTLWNRVRLGHSYGLQRPVKRAPYTKEVPRGCFWRLIYPANFGGSFTTQLHRDGRLPDPLSGDKLALVGYCTKTAQEGLAWAAAAEASGEAYETINKDLAREGMDAAFRFNPMVPNPQMPPMPSLGAVYEGDETPVVSSVPVDWKGERLVMIPKRDYDELSRVLSRRDDLIDDLRKRVDVAEARANRMADKLTSMEDELRAVKVELCNALRNLAHAERRLKR